MEMQPPIWDNGAMQPEPAENPDAREQPQTDSMDTLEQVARELDLSEEVLNNWIASGRLRAYRDRGEVFLRIPEVRQVLEHEEEGTDSEETEDSLNPEVLSLEELENFLGVDARELEILFEAGRFTWARTPDGQRGVLREEVARLVLASAGRAGLLDAAGPGWPDRGDPEPVLGDGSAEELEDDATEETSVGEIEPEAHVPRGAVTVRYFGRMTLRRSFPLLVQGSRLSAPVRIVPRFPGCLCVPAGLELSDERPRGEFWITPQAMGPAPKAALEIIVSGAKLLEVRTPFQVRSLAPAWVLFGLAAAFLLLSPLFELASGTEESPTLFDALFGLLGGPSAAGIVIGTFSFIAGALWLFLTSPAENRPVNASLSAGQSETE
jgi:hypothetical protein